MNCFSCFQAQLSKREHGSPEEPVESKVETKKQKPGSECDENGEFMKEGERRSIAAQAYTFRELATATKHFRQQCLLGEGGFGRVYKGTIALSGQVVAVKQLHRNGLQGNKEFLDEIHMLSLLHHPNLVNLTGYCADGDQRLLVYEYMSGGSLEDHLLATSPDHKPLDWFTRMKIAFGAAKGLEYLHDKANPPIIYRDLKPSNILLDEAYTPKLSDFGLANLSPSGDKMHVSMLGTYGYSAPEYAGSGQLTQKSDVYSFGVVLLELITGRRAMDTTKPIDEQNLVAWAQPIFRDPKRFPDMADPVLDKKFPEKDLNQAVAIAAMCLQEESAARPLMSDVVTALSFLSVVKEEGVPSPLHPSTPPLEEHKDNNDGSDHEEDSASNHDQNQDTDSGGGRRHVTWRSMKSTDESVASSNHRSNRSPQDSSASLGQQKSNVSLSSDGSDSSDDDRGRESPDCKASLRQKSSKKSSYSTSSKSSRKSKNKTHSSRSSSRVSSLSSKRSSCDDNHSNGSDDDDGSCGSQTECFELDGINSMGSEDEADHSS